ncbi:MAG: polyhydroxyalkanoic acid system family protein [Bacteroidetes bacterium]|nr:polyhydroxyalkanoic acid system family protein [Bacteroidota bacterium]
MPTLEMTIPHNLPQQEALQRIKNLLSETKREHGDKIQNLEENWNGNEGNFSFKAMGYDISGTLTVNPSSVELNGKIPFAVSLFKGTITKMINEKAAQLLSA